MRTLFAAALVLLCTACTEPAVPLYQIPTPTSPSPVPTPTPTPAPTPTSTLSVSLQVGPLSPIAGDSAALTAVTGTFNKQPSTYVWTFGDGAVETTTSSSQFYVSRFHTFGRAGAYDARVEMTDGDGRTATAFARVTVQSPAPPPPPAPEPPPPAAPILSATLTCTPKAAGTATPCNVTAAYGASTLPGSSVTKVDWDWGDGGTSTTLAPAAPADSHAYLLAGSYTIFATVSATTVDGPKTATVSKANIIP